MQRIGKIEPLAMKIDGVLDGFPSVYRYMGHPEQVFDRIAEFFRLDLVEAAHHPLEFENHRKRYEDGSGFKQGCVEYWTRNIPCRSANIACYSANIIVPANCRWPACAEQGTGHGLHLHADPA